MELSEKLKQIRIENNLTQQELADALCLSRTAITKYERGYCVPNLDTLILISKYYETNIFDEYKNKFKLFLLSLKCIYPYIISIILLIFSSLYLVINIVNTNNAYGYNIYNDELKVKNSDEICIAKFSYLDLKNKLINRANSTYSFTDNNLHVSTIELNNKFINSLNYYCLIFIEIDNNIYKNSGQYNSSIKITHKPFIYPLKDYNESLPYDKQTGECKEILDYYIKLIDKVK